jgi:chromate reductase
MISLDNMPVYNQDYDEENRAPKTYVVFRNSIKALDGVIFITPEHNRSIPAVLKNAIDIGSRPKGKNVWSGKPSAVFSHSPGNLSAFGANHHLRQCLVPLNVPTMQQPEVYLANIQDSFNEKGKIKNASTKDFLQKVVDAYIGWFEKIAGTECED